MAYLLAHSEQRNPMLLAIRECFGVDLLIRCASAIYNDRASDDALLCKVVAIHALADLRLEA
jgi:hypothetical protein